MIARDVDTVARAAAHLDIAEVALFGKAYRKWYGRSIDELVLDRHFVRFMFAGVVPHWVRAYARQVLEDVRRDRLQPGRFGVVPVPRRQIRLGVCMLLMAVLVFALLLALAHGSLEFLPASTDCVLPPCY